MNLEEDYPRDVELEIDVPGAIIRYTTDGTEPDASSPVAPSLLRVDKGDVIKARGFTAEGEPLGVLMTREFGK